MISEALASSRYQSLLRMLDEEKLLILSGNDKKLRELTAKREGMMEELLGGRVSLPEAFISSLHAKVEQNRKLLRKMKGAGR